MKSRTLLFVALSSILTVAVAVVLTAYKSDKQQFWNRDAAQSATDVISTLSCIINQTGADQETANSSSYAVWVDEDRCRAGSMDSSDAGVQYSKYWVQQELIDGVLKVRWWEYGDAINGERPTYVSAEIIKGEVEGSANPYGVWSVNLCISHLAGDLVGKTGDEACHQQGHTYISETNEYGLFYKRVASGTSTAYEKLTAGAVDQYLASGFGKFKETLANGSVR